MEVLQAEGGNAMDDPIRESQLLDNEVNNL
jgi:hypothetical protein